MWSSKTLFAHWPCVSFFCHRDCPSRVVNSIRHNRHPLILRMTEAAV